MEYEKHETALENSGIFNKLICIQNDNNKKES